jgi:malate dehydrogenase (oxaloacetate-decarboxylating)
MIHYRIVQNSTGQKVLELNLHGKSLLSIPQFNKGTAFTQQERESFGLLGKLPYCEENIEQQAKRALEQFDRFQDPLNKNSYLNELLNQNQTLFYYLLEKHLAAMLPIVYTPVVGLAVTSFHKRSLRPRGLYISYPDRDRIDEILGNRTNFEVRLIVVSDGEGVLGIGDQGADAMAIPVAKLIVYTAFAGLNPNYTLPIILDAGTNNQELLDDPLYLGWRHPRISGKEYDAFVETFVNACQRKFPNLFLHWEDFGRTNAYNNLSYYRNKLCSFNDDIQGTGIVALSAFLAAVRYKNEKITDQRIVVFGAGSAGIGVCDRIAKAIEFETSESFSQSCFWLVDRYGLITDTTPDITDAQRPYVKSRDSIKSWNVKNPEHITLEEVVKHLKPTMLIGTSAQAGAFTQTIIETMAKYTEHPILFILSNPNEKAEATPDNCLRWTDGKALIATGSPFAPIEYKGKTYTISQCNNYLAFPGLGLAVTAIHATHVSDEMLMAAALAISQHTHPEQNQLLPSLDEARATSLSVAIAVAKKAIEQGFSPIKNTDEVEHFIKQAQWTPHYLPYRYTPNLG